MSWPLVFSVAAIWDLEPRACQDMTMCKWSMTHLGAAIEKREEGKGKGGGGGGGGEATGATRPTMLLPTLHCPPTATAIQAQPSDSFHALHHRRIATYAHLMVGRRITIEATVYDHRVHPLQKSSPPRTPIRSGHHRQLWPPLHGGLGE
jgi:hypothetical protein